MSDDPVVPPEGGGGGDGDQCGLTPPTSGESATSSSQVAADTLPPKDTTVPTATLIDFDAPEPVAITPAAASNIATSSGDSSSSVISSIVDASMPSSSTTSILLIPTAVTTTSSVVVATLSSDTMATIVTTAEDDDDTTAITRAFTSLKILDDIDREVAKLDEVKKEAEEEEEEEATVAAGDATVATSEKDQPTEFLNVKSYMTFKTVDSTVQTDTSVPPSEVTTTPSRAPATIATIIEEDDLEEMTISTSSEDKSTTVVVPAGGGGGGGGPGSPGSTSLFDLKQEYHLKWIKWKGNARLPIVTQNSNGPCPLIAIINVLLLRKNIEFPAMVEIITAQQLMEYLCDFLLNTVPTNLDENVKLDYEQNLNDTVTILPRLSTGLDVNVRFSGISDFEYTSECIIFDLLRIPLYHGWLVNPTEVEVSRVVNSQSYNQLVDRIITNKGSSNPTVSSEMFIAEEFLNQSASQLTNYGLTQLIQRVHEDELCILFRNNHFITLYKYKGKLFQLVTDQGFLTESNVVWESLNNIEGDTHFVDGEFVLVPPKPAIILSPPVGGGGGTIPGNTQQQIDQDYLIALSLEQEQKLELERSGGGSNGTGQTVLPSPSGTRPPPATTGPLTVASIGSPTANSVIEAPPPLSDEELARRLQAEEQAAYEAAHRETTRTRQAEQQQQQQAARHQLPANSARNRYGSSEAGSGSRTSNHNSSTERSSSGVPHSQSSTRHSNSSQSGGGGGSHQQQQQSSRSTSHRGSGGDRSSSGPNADDTESSRGRSKNCSIQ